MTRGPKHDLNSGISRTKVRSASPASYCICEEPTCLVLGQWLSKQLRPFDVSSGSKGMACNSVTNVSWSDVEGQQVDACA